MTIDNDTEVDVTGDKDGSRRDELVDQLAISEHAQTVRITLRGTRLIHVFLVCESWRAVGDDNELLRGLDR